MLRILLSAQERPENVKSQFKLFEHEKGAITFQSLRKACHAMGEHLTDDQIRHMPCYQKLKAILYAVTVMLMTSWCWRRKVGGDLWMLVTYFECWCPTLVDVSDQNGRNPHEHLIIVTNTFYLQHPSPTSM